MRKAILVLLLLSSLSVFDVRGQLNKDYFFYMGRNLLMEDRYEAAIETLNVLIDFDNDLYEAYFLRGIAKYNLGDLLGAEYDFTIAIKRNPVYTMAFNYRAITRAQIGNYDDALNDFEEAIDLRPDLPGPYFNRGVTYLQSGQYEKAIEDLNKYIRREDKVVNAYIVRGEAYLNLQDTVRAYQEFNTAIRTNRLNPSGYYRRGLLHAMQSQYDYALADFSQSLECDSTYLPSYFSRAIVYSSINKPMMALEDLDRVISINSSYMVAFFNRAIIRSSIGDYNGALSDYDTVANYNPNNVLVYYNRAGLFSYLGNYVSAINDYTKAIELYPDFANAYLFRSELRARMMDERGSQSDRTIAENKIAEYRFKLADSTFSVYADTSRNFQQLLSFDTKFAKGDLDGKAQVVDLAITLMPMFRFSFTGTSKEPEVPVSSYYSPEMTTFMREIDNPHLVFTTKESDISPHELIAIGQRLENEINTRNSDWLKLFEQGVTQSLIKQYTNSVNLFSAAIEKNTANPFLYLNRSTIRTEMITFISSLENSYQRISMDNDPASRLKFVSSRTYNYDEAISDLNKAIKLLPDFAHSHYNRGNLNVLSGRLPDAYDDYTKAIALFPSFAEAYYNRGLVQIYLKDTRKGLLDLSKAGELGIKEAYQLLKTYGTSE